jgi:hypothetical protein
LDGSIGTIAGRFDGHAEVLKQYMRYRLMQNDQGYIGSQDTAIGRLLAV